MSNHSPKLLIVDDEPAFRKALRLPLAARGFDVAEAKSGEEALVLLAGRPVDVVLLDLNMPGLDGLETCRRIRRMFPATAIVMVSVCDGEKDQAQAKEAGADDYVTKPFRLREMIARIHAVLDRRPLPPRVEVASQP